MSQLGDFTAHCRAMATASHRPHDCPDRWKHQRLPDGSRGPEWPESARPCGGCLTDADRVLWGRLADEAEAYAGRTVPVGAAS